MTKQDFAYDEEEVAFLREQGESSSRWGRSETPSFPCRTIFSYTYSGLMDGTHRRKRDSTTMYMEAAARMKNLMKSSAQA